MYVALNEGGEKSCTGSLVQDHQILTAAHCVHGDSFSGDFYILFGQTGEQDYYEEAKGDISHCQVPDQYKNEDADEYDWAYCVIDRPDEAEDVTPLTKASSVAAEVDMTVVGYPSAQLPGFPDYPVGYTPYAASCHAKFDGKEWLYKLATEVNTEGLSGSPLLRDDDDDVFGNHAGYNEDSEQQYGVPSVVRPA